MSAASPRDLPGRVPGSRAEPEVKSGSHSIPGARVDDAISDITNLLHTRKSERSNSEAISVNTVLDGILVRTTEAVFTSKISDKLANSASDDGVLTDLKKQANSIKLELDNANIPSCQSFFPSKFAIAFAANKSLVIMSTLIATSG